MEENTLKEIDEIKNLLVNAKTDCGVMNCKKVRKTIEEAVERMEKLTEEEAA